MGDRGGGSTYSIYIDKIGITLADSIDPIRIGFAKALVAIAVHGQSLTDALHLNDRITRITNTNATIPDRVGYGSTLID